MGNGMDDMRKLPLRTGTDVPPEALYVHIPFCASRCHYCDFATYVAPSEVRDAYVQALVRELEGLSERASVPLKSIFFGGGTPTLLSASQLAHVLGAVQRLFSVSTDAEFTFEANPGTVTPEKLQVLKSFGVNRISFGAQTFNETLLLAIGRLHDAQTVDSSVEMAKAAGFERISVDLMFGLPDQTLGDVAEAIDRFLSYKIEHVSAYWLKIEQGTPFADWRSQGLLQLPGEDAEADMYDFVRHALEKQGFNHYEVSNFARPGKESRHNLVYWHNKPYLAAGVGAYGYVEQQRYANTRSLTDYMASVNAGRQPVNEVSIVSPEEYAENTMMLGLRLREGVSREAFLRRHGVELEDVFGDVIASLLSRELVQWVDKSLCLTPQAWPVGNLVFEEFVGVLTDN